jgi:murein DD-endopeptidase MepM/ murein hydrolase activator NlpD
VLRLLLLSIITIGDPWRQAQPELWLPTPPGETWRVIQGYGCGTHDDWDYHSLDLVAADGDSLGRPVRAAAAGEVWAWVEESGTLILGHGDDFFTMYTHLGHAVEIERGTRLARGEVVGYVGERGTPGNPHLHFTAFRDDGEPIEGRRSLPLRFADGYLLPSLGGCNQHGDTLLTASAEGAPPADITPPTMPASQFIATAKPYHGALLRWAPAHDASSGVAGYHVYVGRNAHGTSPRFTTRPQLRALPYGPGRYLVRVQPVDHAGNAGDWRTVGRFIVR